MPDNDLRDMTDSIAKEWLRVQRLICAHKRKRDRDQHASNLLNWGTVVAAVITAASTSLTGFPLATALAAVLTAALAAFDKAFSPTKNVENLWKTQRRLETSQNELLTLLYNLPVQKSIGDAQRALAHISDAANDAISIPVSDNDEDRAEADREFRGTVLYFRLAEATISSSPGVGPAATDDVMGDDAIDVIAVPRRKRLP
jgi:hypothetical protein